MLPFFDTSDKLQQSLSSREVLWRIFLKLIQRAGTTRTLCVIDGFDECDGESRRWLAKKLDGLPKIENPECVLKIVIVSRNLLGFEQFARTKLDPDNDQYVEDDIKLVVAARVQELFDLELEGFNLDFQSKIERTLLNRAEGTFLWVGFVMLELLQKTTCTEVERALDEFPDGLHAVYDRMLGLIEASNKGICSRILVWATLALRPRTLEELAAAIETQSVVPRGSGYVQVMRDYVKMCGSLLTVQDTLVSLVHQSVREYFIRRETDTTLDLKDFRFRPEEEHLRLALRCLDYLQYHFQKQGNKSPGNIPSMLAYAIQYWPEHAKLSSTFVEKVFDHSSGFFERNSSLSQAWWFVYMNQTENPWLLHSEPSYCISPVFSALFHGWKSC